MTLATIPKSCIRHIAIGVDPGTSVADAIREATITALRENVPVSLVFKGKSYRIDPSCILRLAIIQAPNITGVHLVTPRQG